MISFLKKIDNKTKNLQYYAQNQRSKVLSNEYVANLSSTAEDKENPVKQNCFK